MTSAAGGKRTDHSGTQATVNFMLCREPNVRFTVKMRASTNRAPGSPVGLRKKWRGSRAQPGSVRPANGTKQMKTRVIIEYDLPAGDRVVVRDQEGQRWITSETVLIG